MVSLRRGSQNPKRPARFARRNHHFCKVHKGSQFSGPSWGDFRHAARTQMYIVTPEKGKPRRPEDRAASCCPAARSWLSRGSVVVRSWLGRGSVVSCAPWSRRGKDPPHMRRRVSPPAPGPGLAATQSRWIQVPGQPLCHTTVQVCGSMQWKVSGSHVLAEE